MKKQVIICAVFILLSTGCRMTSLSVSAQESAPMQEKIDFLDPQTWILGWFGPERLSRKPYSEWYNPGFDNYEGNLEVVRKLLDMDKGDISVLVVMGTWCPDSRREVPRFMKILTETNFPLKQVKFLGVDNVKKAPVENYDSYEIMRVPTFIFFVKNVEAGRIIENPSSSLEQDMLNILTGNRNN